MSTNLHYLSGIGLQQDYLFMMDHKGAQMLVSQVITLVPTEAGHQQALEMLLFRW